ncbi:MAG: hypothetical protein HPAVJP_2430 [Candidatus Hepatoplasma vulgare]|nr:MAG: hypothetical protein HPAVJP_2430 [Candidatus Hepatoplasma sp.]
MKKKIIILFLPLFLIIINLPFKNINFKKNNINENNDFKIISSYFNIDELLYDGKVDSDIFMTSLITKGIYSGDVSQINSITFDYQIKSENDTEYHNVSFNVDKNSFKIKSMSSNIFFYVELPIYYNYSTYFNYLESGTYYYILNPTLLINNIDGTIVSTTYEQDYEIIPGETVYDNGDQSYPKIEGVQVENAGKMLVLFSDGDNFNFFDYSSFSIYHYEEFYDLYDTNNENLLLKNFTKLTPISKAKKIEDKLFDGLYVQEFKLSENEIDPPLNYSYKSVNNSLFLILNENYQSISYALVNSSSNTVFHPPIVYEKNISNITLNSNKKIGNPNYFKLDIYLNRIDANNNSSYKEFTKHIKIGFNWNILLNVEDSYGIHNEWDSKSVTYEAQEVSEINSSLLNMPGLYYQNSDIINTSDNMLHYTYYLVLPDENYWIYKDEQTYANKMIFSDFCLFFPSMLNYDSKSGYEYYYLFSPDYENDNLIIPIIN